MRLPKLDPDLVDVIASVAAAVNGAADPIATARSALKRTHWRAECEAASAYGDGNALRLSSWKWTALRRFRDPRQVAGCVLAALGASVVEMLELRASDVAPDGSWVRLSGDVIPVPPPARTFIRTQLVAHRRGNDQSPLLADTKGIPTPYALRRTVAAAFEEAGQSVPPLSIQYRVHPAQRWLARHGLRLLRREPQSPGTPWITRNAPPPRNGLTHPWRREALRIAVKRRRYDLAGGREKRVSG